MSPFDLPPQDTGFAVSEIVTSLREIREQSLEHRQRKHRPPKLPSRKVLAKVVEYLAAALFPNRLGPSGLNNEGLDYFVGHSLDTALRDLSDQALHELQLNGGSKDVKPFAHALVRQFSAKLPNIRTLLDSDLQAAYEGDPAAGSVDEVLVCYPGIHAMIHHRIAHELHRLGLPLVARIIAEIAHSETGIDIHPGAAIAKSFFIDHGTGVVIGETAVIGERVRVYQAVTLGAKRFLKDEDGLLVKGNERHPIVEDDVVIYAGATVLGRITIGKGSVIGGNVWLTHGVPEGSVITQNQAKEGGHISD